jgi:hypothetical protein
MKDEDMIKYEIRRIERILPEKKGEEKIRYIGVLEALAWVLGP